MNKSVPLFVLLLLYSFSSWSQLTDLTVLSPGGGSFKGESLHLDWTLGETVVATGTYGNNMLTQGFHQPIVILKQAPVKDTRNQPDIKVRIAPNPVTTVLSVEIHTPADEKSAFQLMDMFGRTLLTIKPTTQKLVTINLAGYQQGNYFLQVLRENGELIRTFKVIKLK